MINKAKLHGIIREVLMDNPWTLSNDILYKICKNYPSNIDKESVLAKTLIIGRVYSVALERGVGEKKTKGGEFYIKNVFPKISSFFSEPNTIELLKELKKSKNFSKAIELHGKLVKTLYGLREANKISFASKYLHFHFPNKFYIYDSRAQKGIRILNYHYKGWKKISKENRISSVKDANKEYLNFVSKCEIMRPKLIQEFGKLSVRKFDTILINIAESVS